MVSRIRAVADPDMDTRCREEHAKLIHRFVVDFLRNREREATERPDPLRWMPWVDPRAHAQRRDRLE